MEIDADYVLQMLRRYSQKAMALHLQHFGLVQKGAESHSVLVTVCPCPLLTTPLSNLNSCTSSISTVLELLLLGLHSPA